MKATWERGFSDAEMAQDKSGFLGKIRKGMNKGMNDEGYVFLWTPRSLAYIYGFNSRKELIDGQTKKAWQDTLFDKSVLNPQQISVSGFLYDLTPTISYSYDYTKITRSDTITDIRVALKVGNHVYAADKQPGDLKDEEIYNLGDVLCPQLSVGLKPTLGAVESYAIASTRRSTFNGNYQTWIVGRFYCTISLFDEDGTPRIGPADANFQIIVRYGNKEGKVTYSLSDWEKRGF